MLLCSWICCRVQVSDHVWGCVFINILAQYRYGGSFLVAIQYSIGMLCSTGNSNCAVCESYNIALPKAADLFAESVPF
jgi:hypothetical protein